VKPAKSGKAMPSELSVWTVNRENKAMRQAFSLPPAAVANSCGVLSYSELTMRNSIEAPATYTCNMEDAFEYPAWGGARVHKKVLFVARHTCS
jgi:hypothetical protein